MLIFLTVIVPGACFSGEKVTIVGSHDYAPFYFRDVDGNLNGIFVDIWNLWAQKTGIAVEFQSMEFAQALEAVRSGPWKLHLPRKAAQRVYWAQQPQKMYLNLDRALLNNLDEDLGEKRDLSKSNTKQAKELQKLAAEMGRELGDWNSDGLDRPKLTYPGNLNLGPKQKAPRVRKKRKGAQ